MMEHAHNQPNDKSANLIKAINKKNIIINASEFSPLNLAYIGDGVFELLVRTYIMSSGNRPVNDLNKKASSIVKASSQAAMYKKVEPFLKDKELAILKRGRNAKSATHAKNATVGDYRHATGLEALFGFLYLDEQTDRLIELFDMCIE